jgi:hypothetical protein
MRVARVKMLLWLTSAAGLGGAAAALVAAWRLPLDATVPPDPGARVTETTPTTTPSLPPLASFEPAWRRPLRRPLADPPPPASPVLASAQPAKPPNLMVRLVGTIVDGQHPRGVFLVGLAGIELKAVGEKAGGAEILRVDENTATLSYGGETFTLKRERSPFDISGTGPTPPAASSRDKGDDDGL